ncbi:MAG: hypothetical protein PF795_04190 [Kiritimatiellae bacterium]|jgi:hypothetical protein|nr:hypothetical protein [Kiritimatiellia bacterium]
MQKAISYSVLFLLFVITGCGDTSSPGMEQAGKEEVHPLRDFTEALESAGIEVVRTETADSHFPDSSGTRYILYINSDLKIEPDEEWIEVYRFETLEEARSTFPDEGVEIQGRHQNSERNGNMVLFTYDHLTLWDHVYQAWIRM